ncbi:HAD-like protein [Microstroma glucosiphilum]|uniref:HAD-like protein n=1 Tax=Pseudomicrostroma glucosiphilum TaxID=1684307 RepID=A0A316UAC2_9BASI|nr:HAD-like protein [Pseudomicrostroma glucosiphilum]PWN19975.1 HAD-like protein [Pseudomicrostroma glucosiphilum]
MAIAYKPVTAVLFDMDGLLIDSEGVYTKVVNEVLKPYGLEQGWDLKMKLMGMPEKKAVETLLANFWPPEKEGEIFAAECPFTIESFLSHRNMNLDEEFSKVKPMPGAQRLIDHLAKHNIPVCVATGSKTRNFKIKSSANPDLFAPFKGRAICGDDERLKRGKPFADVFLLAAREGLGEPSKWQPIVREPGPEHDGTLKGGEEQFLVFEDATGGVKAAKAAGMQVVWVPDPQLRAIADEKEVAATLTINSLEDFRPELFGLPPFDN